AAKAKVDLPRSRAVVTGSSAERKAKRFDSRLDELYLELAIGDRSPLPHQLICPLARRRPSSLFVEVGSVLGTAPLSMHLDGQPHGRRALWWTHYQVHVPGVKAIHDPAVRCVHHDSSPIHGPVTGERPLIEGQSRRNGVHARRVEQGITRRREPL